MLEGYFVSIVVTQEYVTDALNSYIMVGNTALVKCEIPSFVTDFVKVESWIDERGVEFFAGIGNEFGNYINPGCC